MHPMCGVFECNEESVGQIRVMVELWCADIKWNVKAEAWLLESPVAGHGPDRPLSNHVVAKMNACKKHMET